MNGTSEQKIDALRQEYDRLRRNTNLTRVADMMWRLSREVGRFIERIDALQHNGYIFTKTLAAKARELCDRWRDTEDEFNRVMRDVRYDIGRDVDRVDDTIRDAERSLDARNIRYAEDELQYAKRRVQDAERRLERIYDRDQRDILALDGRLDALEWTLQQRNAARFNFDPGESLIIAAPAEWIESASEHREMDGILYLTDKRILFEQKERTGAFLGIFGGKDQQALRWAVRLDNIQDVRAEDRGIFGANDMLYLRLSPGSDRDELTVEIKRSADNQEWAAFIRHVQSGDYETERQ
jgi:hypothetical protein